MEKGLIIKSAKGMGLNIYRCFADINIVMKKANSSRKRDANLGPQSEAAGFSTNGYAEHMSLFFS